MNRAATKSYQLKKFMEKILAINAHLKYVEYLLLVFDTYTDETILKTIRKDFEKRFSTQHILLNPNFGIYRLLPIILMKLSK
jgi:hypothetical protein